MTPRLKPLLTYTPRSYPRARGTALGKLLVAASMAATSLGGCGPAVDPSSVDKTVDSGDLDGTVEEGDSDIQDHTPANPEQ
jgi:hypothetical protein